MIGLDSPAFWLMICALTFVTRGLQPRPGYRALVFALATGALFSLSGLALASYAGLVAVAAYGFVALRVGKGNWAVGLHAVGMSLVFVASQYATRAPFVTAGSTLGQVLPLVGLPYVYLRYLHLLVEVRGGRMQPPPALEYLAYLLPFHQLLAGPIERYPQFQKQLNAAIPPLDRDTCVLALNRITNGFVKKGVLAEILRSVLEFEFQTTGWRLWVEIDLYAIYMYLDFSGYMDIIIGAGMLIGWTPPENFNWPYFSRNIIEFWTRWHITLGDWIRDYLFMPANLWLQRGLLRNWPLLAGTICFILSMVYCGLWHRTNLQFGIWGLLHGLGIVACKYYEVALKRVLGRKRLKSYRASWLTRIAATLVTFHFVAASFLFAFHTPAQAIRILGGLL